MEYVDVLPVLKGAAIAVFMQYAIGCKPLDRKWWVGVLTLNFIVL